MKFNLKIILIAIIGFSISLSSCQKEKTLSALPLTNDATYEASSYDITITSNTDWTISSDSDWVTVSATSGSNDGLVTVNFTENTTSDERNAIITVAGTDVESIILALKQTSNPDYNNLIGTWKMDEGNGAYSEMTFAEDLSGTEKRVHEDASEDTQSFTYSFTATNLTISFEGGDTHNVPYSISDNKLTIEAPDGTWIYTKQ